MVSNCLVCLYNTAFDPIRPLYPVRAYCQHSKFYKSPSPEYKLFKPIWVTVILGVIGLLFSALSCVRYLPSLWNNSRSSCLIVIADQVFILSLATVGCVSCLKMKNQLQDFTSWSKLIELRNLFGLKDIFNDSQTETFVRRRKILLLSLDISIIILLLMHYFLTYDNMPWIFLRKMAIVFCTTFQSYLTLESCQRTFVIGAFLRAIKAKSFKSADSFSQTTRLVMIINRNIALLITYMKFAFPIWIFAMTVNLILNIYILIEYTDYSVFALTMLQLRTVGIITLLCFLLFIHDGELTSQCEDILSFLFSYPVSKLTYAEAAQLEALITVMTIQKPVMKLSDSFTVGARLLASISGVVLTYVLVALQFNPTWTYEN